ncbi:hypothetical protein BDK51DRAFT_32825 [Blyttiomyces helicus]|uniref:Uncharacterized protein n=1 Tax=Blyttiomyces helicus TaxID=388810 RepID=A0A4P9WK13_9FUNG|nr:hypothetical protein BDK51DRAFT_32825 [Blyttiomyces helicus]|eukprot:RKO91480.1 hypothetical protein BDK51DRAFT_32825 [Blyttiomyces helicus]
MSLAAAESFASFRQHHRRGYLGGGADFGNSCWGSVEERAVRGARTIRLSVRASGQLFGSTDHLPPRGVERFARYSWTGHTLLSPNQLAGTLESRNVNMEVPNNSRCSVPLGAQCECVLSRSLYPKLLEHLFTNVMMFRLALRTPQKPPAPLAYHPRMTVTAAPQGTQVPGTPSPSAPPATPRLESSNWKRCPRGSSPQHTDPAIRPMPHPDVLSYPEDASTPVDATSDERTQDHLAVRVGHSRSWGQSSRLA